MEEIIGGEFRVCRCLRRVGERPGVNIRSRRYRLSSSCKMLLDAFSMRASDLHFNF
jgi:hypothetical protein